MSVVVGHDAIRANILHLPAGQVAGYTTGTDGSGGTVDIRWRASDWNAHPGAVRICQDPGATDQTADILDVESGAATVADCAPWAAKAHGNYTSAARPGQRIPAIYTSASNVTAVANALTAAKLTGVGLWVANWNLTQAQAYADVVNAAGPFPIIGVQWASGPFYDTNVFSGSWLGRVSAAAGTGSHTHKTVAGDTLGSISDSRKMDIWTWLEEQQDLSIEQATHLVRHAAPEVGSTWRSA